MYWKIRYISANATGKRSKKNIIRERTGNISYAKRKITGENISCPWRLFINERKKYSVKYNNTLEKNHERNIKVLIGFRISMNWMLSLHSCMVVGFLTATGLSIYSLRSNIWEQILFPETMSRDIFLTHYEVLVFLYEIKHISITAK